MMSVKTQKRNGAELCETFRSQAGLTWSLFKRSRRTGIPIHEETITQIVLSEIVDKHSDTIITHASNKREESDHKGDWLWVFPEHGSYNEKGIAIRVQAKRLYEDGDKYKALDNSQLQGLINKAKGDKCVPMYCFYNHEGARGVQFRSSSCHHRYRKPSCWGCSVALATSVQATNSNKIEDLFKCMRPWHELVCFGREGLLSRVCSSLNDLPRVGDKTENVEIHDFSEWIREAIHVIMRSKNWEREDNRLEPLLKKMGVQGVMILKTEPEKHNT